MILITLTTAGWTLNQSFRVVGDGDGSLSLYPIRDGDVNVRFPDQG